VPLEIECVVEFMDRGDLKNVLESTTPSTFTWAEKLNCALSIGEGLVFLHSLNIIHRDLKSRNVLLDTNKGTKLTDFGVAKETNDETMTVGVGTYRWMAPEILKEHYYSVAADVFSFGMVLSELSTHHIPYSDLRTEKGRAYVDTAIMSMVIQGELKPTFSPDCPTWLRDLAMRCIEINPEDRPTAAQLSFEIRSQLYPTRRK